MATSPAASSLVRWLERLPLVSPVVRCRKTKSASLTKDTKVRIASRPGSWMSRSRIRSSLGWAIGVLVRQALGRPKRLNEQAVVKHAADHGGPSGEHDTDVARIRAVPDGQGARYQERAPDNHVVRLEAHPERVGDQH